MKKISIFFIFLFSLTKNFAQQGEQLIQFTGIVTAEERGELIPIPYANVYMKNKSRGTYSDIKGYFSFVAAKGEKVVFSSVGYKSVEITIPDTLTDTRYSVVQMLSKDNVNLPATVIYPWPSREHFKIEFLALNVHDELHKRAMENLAEKEMRRMRRELAYDGKETSKLFLQEKANQAYYTGQFRPMNIFNPLAWAKFVQAWKDGKFKQKPDTE
jgi:CarboxypepD_reg-like domain